MYVNIKKNAIELQMYFIWQHKWQGTESLMQKSPLLCNDSVTKTPTALMLVPGEHLTLHSVQNLSSAQVLFGTRPVEMFIIIPKLYF